MLRMFFSDETREGKNNLLKKVTKLCVSVFFTLTLQQVISINQYLNW